MPWWDNSLYDTCSLITVDKLLLDHPELAHHFPHVLAIEASFSADQLRETTAQRMRQRVTLSALPTVSLDNSAELQIPIEVPSTLDVR
jgi:hypothetical protein